MMFRKSFKVLSALLTLALLAGFALAADPAPKPAEEKKPDLFSWTPTHGKRLVRKPFTTRFAAHGRYVVVGDNQ